MPTYRLERCLDRLSGVEVYSGQMTRASGATHRVTFQVVTTSEAEAATLRAFGERLARVAHPAVPRLRDVFSIDGHPVHVTEEIVGRSLDRLVLERPVPVGAVFEIGAQVAGALEAVHGGTDRATGLPLGLRHELLAPGFVYLDRHGEVRLLGIGTTRPAGPADPGLGLSPERVLAQEEGLESDVFALSALLYLALAQAPLFEGRDVAGLRELMVDPLALRAFTDERVAALGDRLPSERGAALLRAMTAARKADRPTMAQVAARCDLISDSVGGPGLLEFARARVPAAAPETIEGRFEGRTVETDGPSLWSITETPPPPTPRPATGRAFSPRKTPAEPIDRDPVLGEQEPVQTASNEAAVSSEGPMPWSPAESVALFERTPSLAPPRELQPIIVNPHRVPQLLRQDWDDGVARRYKLAAMAEQLVDEVVDEETPTLVVRDGEPADAENQPTDPDVSEPTSPVGPPTPQSYDAPEVAEAGAGGPRKPVSVPLRVPSASRSQTSDAEIVSPVAASRTPPAFPAPAGLESAIGSVPPTPAFAASGSAGASPTVVPATDAGDDAILGSESGEPPVNSLAGAPPVASASSGLPVSMVAGVILGGLLGLVAGAAVLYLFFSAAP